MTAPRPSDAADVLGDEAVGASPVERLLEVGAEETVLFAVRLDAPALAPVAVGRRARRDVVEEARLVDAGAREHHGDAHDRAARVRVAGGAGAEGEVRVAGRVHDALRENGEAAGLALGHDPFDAGVLDDRLGGEAVEQRRHAGLSHELVRDHLEELGVERLALRLEVRRRGAHLLGAALELRADAAGFDGALVPVPGQGVDADLGDDAAETAVAVDQGGRRPGASGGEGGGETAGPAAHHEHLRLVHDRRRPRRLRDVPHRALPWREAPSSRHCLDRVWHRGHGTYQTAWYIPRATEERR